MYVAKGVMWGFGVTSLWKYMRPLAQAATTDMAWILAS